MIVNSDPLIDALRDELQEYGGLLSLFDEQQKAILARQPDAVLVIQDSIRTQLDTIHVCRKHREQVASELAVLLGQDPASSVKSLIDFCDEVVRPLLHSLIYEVNQLISKTRRRGQQNQMLLARSIEVSQQILQRLNPDAMTKTYSRGGRIKLSRGGAASTYLARS
jgi:flagellar biosynthesis/type III secretory pathway chaperone